MSIQIYTLSFFPHCSISLALPFSCTVIFSPCHSFLLYSAILFYTFLYFPKLVYTFFVFIHLYHFLHCSAALPFSCTVLFPTSSDCGNQATPFYLPPNTKLLSANILQHWDFHCFPPGFLLFYPHVELMNPNTHKIYTIFSRSTQFMFVAKTFCHTHKWEG